MLFCMHPTPTRLPHAAVTTALLMLMAGCATPSAPPETEGLARLPISQAISALAEGRSAQATDVAQRWVLANPGSSQGHLLLAASHPASQTSTTRAIARSVSPGPAGGNQSTVSIVIRDHEFRTVPEPCRWRH